MEGLLDLFFEDKGGSDVQGAFLFVPFMLEIE